MALGTPQEQAQTLVLKFTNEGSPHYFLDPDTAKSIAKISVSNIIEALESHGRNFGIIGDMDSEWRYWNAVDNEIDRIC
jgi:hypothetical protein